MGPLDPLPTLADGAEPHQPFGVHGASLDDGFLQK